MKISFSAYKGTLVPSTNNEFFGLILSALIISVFVLNSCGDCLHPIKSAYTTVKEATCTEEGRREAVCSDCHEVISEVIKKKAHDYELRYKENKA